MIHSIISKAAETIMRGRFTDQGGLSSYIAPDKRVPTNHPLRKVRELVRDVLSDLNHDQASEPSAGRDTACRNHAGQWSSASSDGASSMEPCARPNIVASLALPPTPCSDR
jgi:hypothetical protein